MGNHNKISIGGNVNGDVNVQSSVYKAGLAESEYQMLMRAATRVVEGLQQQGASPAEVETVRAELQVLETEHERKTLTKGRARHILQAASMCANGIAASLIAAEIATWLPFLQ